MKELEIVELIKKGYLHKEISKILNVSISTISLCAKKYDLVGFNKKNKNTNHSAFSSFTEESMYWLGFLWADGYVKYEGRFNIIDLECIDLDHMEKFKSFIGAKDIKIRDRKKSICYRVSVASDQICKDLYSYGFNLKDKRVDLPKIPEDYMIYFIRGYFDGDGNISINGAINISGRFEFMEKLYNYIKLFHRKEKHSTNSLRIYTNVDNGYKFLELIYNNASIYLNRKYNSALSVRNDRVINRAKSVKAETLIPS